MQAEHKIFRYPYAYPLELGRELPGFELSYSTYGTRNLEDDNIVWICHALTGNSDAAEWWDGLVGDGKYINSERDFIICVNVLGSAYGSTGPLSINPKTQKPYFRDFPTITVKDVVGTLEILRQELNIQKIKLCIGGSLGGQQALEWSVEVPDLFEELILIASNALHSPWGVAFNESQRMAIEADQTWNEDHEDSGKMGMRAARSMALLSYRNYDTYNFTQARDNPDQIDDFRASSYQQYQGDKFVKRFNAYSYWTLSKIMDSHNVGRNRGGIVHALGLVKAKTLVLGIKSDLLFPISEQQFLARHIPDAVFQEIDSLYGHDGFLIEYKQLTQVIRAWQETNGQLQTAKIG
ncbi:homoserine O-acetyltransferase family protein [Dyadobacter frigoris]|uniref:Homoserine O-acetyltransferase n=1 Tax=Dyadobacter frigoris TaxID=2576211 RepID=A0A4U6DAX4_9BACT|nr:homoserine O-acetyltransferase [Dyadobacter frigoris]TKT93601.1 homoserine O-acetyltransferase [Dyadobacter frigoris]GLU54765.1 homoserine O-acetyltransferase [Dyadobacter frigoris]